MKPKSGQYAQSYFSYLAFILSGFFIFNPILSSGNTLLSLFISFFISIVIFELLLFCFSNSKDNSATDIKTKKAIGVLCFCLSSTSTLLLITEVIKSVAFITNRNVSMVYYIAISASILIVSFNLCLGKEKGIYRFSVIASIALIILCLSAPFAFFTTKGFTYQLNLAQNAKSAIKAGVLSGFFILSDTAIYLFTFSRFLRKDNSFLSKNALRFSLVSALILISVFTVCAKLTLSDSLLSDLKDPAYSLIKLIPVIDFTEFLSCGRILSFMIKSSVYIHASSHLLHTFFNTKRLSETTYALCIYLSVPVIYLAFLAFTKKLPYGAFQQYIYASVFTLSLLFILVYLLFEKKRKE